MNEEQQAEFARFEGIENKLIEVFKEDGYDFLQAQELGFFVAQAMRNVPPLLRLLDGVEQHSTDEIMDAVHGFLCNHYAFEQAHRIIMREEVDSHDE